MSNIEIVKVKHCVYVQHLYHITHIANLSTICSKGLLPHGNPYQKKDISDTDVNNRRSRKEPVYGRTIHSYVPFYFNPKNPMLYVRKHLSNEIVILQLSKELLRTSGTLFTDGNASSDGTHFYKDLRELKYLDWDCLQANFYLDIEDGKRKRMAEVLVPNNVSSQAIESILVTNSFTKQKVDTITRKTIPCYVEKSHFF